MNEWEIFISKKDRILERFASLYKKVESGCWEWKENFVSGGYGRTYIARIESCDRHVLAHRLSYMIHFGEIPKNMCVMHKCDNPRCVNPDHLMLGTKGDNNIDRASKGRSSRGDNHYSRTTPERLSRGDHHYSRIRPESLARGSKHGCSKISEQDVMEIRNLKNEGWSLGRLAERFAISKSNVSDVVNRKTWRHVE